MGLQTSFQYPSSEDLYVEQTNSCHGAIVSRVVAVYPLDHSIFGDRSLPTRYHFNYSTFELFYFVPTTTDDERAQQLMPSPDAMSVREAAPSRVLYGTFHEEGNGEQCVPRSELTTEYDVPVLQVPMRTIWPSLSNQNNAKNEPGSFEEWNPNGSDR
jgi:hypothetical protein